MNIEGWTQKSLGSFTQFIKGITYASEDYCKEDEGAIFLTIKCVSKSGGFKLEGIKYYRGIIHENEKLKEGDILISNTDLTRDGDIVGCPIMVPFLGANEVTMSMDLSKLVIDLFQVDSKFLYYKLMTDKVRRFMQDHASGSTVLHLQTKAVPTLELLIPDKKEEQEKIAEVLSRIDRAIAQTEAIIAKQQRIKTGLMQDLLTKGIDENGNIRSEATHEFKDSAIGRIPVEWEIKNLSYTLVDINAGKSPECPDIPAIGDEWGVLKVSAVHPLGFREQENKVITNPIHINYNYEIKDGDLLITRANTPELVGLTCLVVDPPSRLLISDKTLRLVVNKSIAMSEFIFYTTQMFLVRLQIEINATGSSAGMKNISQQAIKNLQISLPNIEEQNRIIQLLSSSTNQINITYSNLIKLKRRKTGLMQDLLTGKVRVTNLLN